MPKPSSRREATLRRIQKADALGREATFKNIMSTTEGRRWMWLLLTEARLFNDEEVLDTSVLAYRAGKRSLGLYLYKGVQSLTPAEHLLMVKESTGVDLEITRADEADKAEAEEQETPVDE